MIGLRQGPGKLFRQKATRVVFNVSASFWYRGRGADEKPVHDHRACRYRRRLYNENGFDTWPRMIDWVSTQKKAAARITLVAERK